jgi:hypothetical protein
VIASALVVGCPEGLLGKLHDAIIAVGLVPRACGVVTLPTAAVRHRPICIVLTIDLYGLDPTGFANLAAEVGASLVTVEEDVSSEELARILAIEIAKREHTTTLDEPTELVATATAGPPSNESHISRSG